MTTTRVETLPTSWDDARDTAFFRITARLFTTELCLGASVLLASNDDDVPATAAPPAPAAAGARTGAPVSHDAGAWRDGDLIPVPVHRTPRA